MYGGGYILCGNGVWFIVMTPQECDCNSVFYMFNPNVKSKSVSECCSGGGYLQYVECKCMKCGREWDE